MLGPGTIASADATSSWASVLWMRARSILVCGGFPAAFTALAHLNIHVFGGAAFDPWRLAVPALLGLAIGLLVHRDLLRAQAARALVAELDAARKDAVDAADHREHLLQHLRRQVRQLRSEQAASVVALGAVHDLRNMLVPIVTAAGLLGEEPELAAEIAPQLEAAAERGRDLCNRILEARTGAVPDPEELDAEAAVDDALRLTVTLLGRAVGVHLALKPARIRADRQDLIQIVHNIVVNSADARAEGLRLDIRGSEVGRAYRISIQDNGPGLPAGFDLAEVGLDEGVGELHGIGLRMVHGMARRNGGRFWLERAEQGALAQLELPLAASDRLVAASDGRASC